MTVEVRPITSRDEWLAWRREDVTASVVPALFDAFPPTYKTTALRLYVEKRGVEFPDEDNKVMRRGRWLEPAVAEAVRELRPDWDIEPAKEYFRDGELRLGATPDFWINDDPRGRGVLQAKTVAPSVWHRDWNDGREPPLWVTLQISTEMMLTDAAFGAIAVMLVDPHNMDVAIVEVERHPAAFERIRAAVRHFWADVAEGNEPQPDFARDAELIKALTQRAMPGSTADLSGNNELPVLLARRAQLRAHIKAAELECAATEAMLKFAMGEAETIIGLDGWHITYKTQQRKGYVVEPSTPRVLMIQDKRPDAEKEPA